MSKAFKVDFYFGNNEKLRIKKSDYKMLSGNVKELNTIYIFGLFSWIIGSPTLSFRSYNKFIITGEYLCVSSWCVLIINRLLGKETYVWTHGWYGNEGHFKSFIKKIYFKLSNKILLYGDYAKKLMIENGLQEDKLEVIYNSLVYEEQLEIRNKLKKTDFYKELFGNEFPVIIFTGRLTPVKKLELLFEAQRLLLDQGISVNVFVVGEGSEKAALEKSIDYLRLKNYVSFYGPCYDEIVMADFFYNASMCVSPGNVGLTGIHAMSYGCPVISHNDYSAQMPEFEVIVNNITGLFFKKDCVSDLANKISEILTLNEASLRTNCFKIVDEKYNTRYQIELLKRLLND